MITEAAEFFARGCGRCARFDSADCSARIWADGVAALRRLCLAAGLEETAKWGHPTYCHAGRNIALIGAFRGDFRLSFFEAGLLSDPSGLLTRQGAGAKHADCARFTAAAEIEARAPALAALLAQAMEHARAGRRVPKEDPTPQSLPAEMEAAFGADPRLGEAFRRLTPGRQKSHVLALAAAKSPETRLRRLEKLAPLILDGKGANER